MKKFYMFALIVMGFAMVGCNDDMSNGEVMLPDDVVEMESWISEQNGEFNDSDFIEVLVHGVFDIVDQDLYTIDGKYIPGDHHFLVDGGPTPSHRIIFNEDGTFLMCYNFHTNYALQTMSISDGFLKGEWTYDEKSRVLTYSWLDILWDKTTPRCVDMEVKYLKGNIAIMDEKHTRLDGKGNWVERVARCRVKFDVIGRDEALAKYVNDINALRSEVK